MLRSRRLFEAFKQKKVREERWHSHPKAKIQGSLSPKERINPLSCEEISDGKSPSDLF